MSIICSKCTSENPKGSTLCEKCNERLERNIVEKFISKFNTKKNLLILSFCSLCILLLLLLLIVNLKYISTTYLTATKNYVSIIKIVNRDITDQDKQHQKYFYNAIKVLSSSPTADNIACLETQFSKMNAELKILVVDQFNEDKILFKDSSIVFSELLNNSHPTYITYIKRLSTTQLEEGCVQLFGSPMQVNRDNMKRLHQILNDYNSSFTLKGSLVSPYELLLLIDKNPENTNLVDIMNYLDGDYILSSIQKQMVGDKFNANQLYTWGEIFLKQEVITDKQYTSLNAIYSEMQQLETKRKAVLQERDTALNEKEKIDHDILDLSSEIKNTQQEFETVLSEVDAIDNEYRRLTNYENKTLYIISDNGDNEYEVAIPTWNYYLNSYMPTEERAILKTTETRFTSKGVAYVNVYYKGQVDIVVKESYGGFQQSWPLYIEVSTVDNQRLSEITSTLYTLQNQIDGLGSTIQQLKDKLTNMKKNTDYNGIEKNIYDLKIKEAEYNTKIQSKIDSIKGLFNIAVTENLVPQADSPTPTPISDQQILQLIADAYSCEASVISGYHKDNIPGPNITLLAKPELDTFEKIRAYMGKYWSKNYIDAFLSENKGFFKEVNNKLYLQIGDYGFMDDFNGGTVIASVDNGTQKNVEITVPGPYVKESQYKFILDFTDNRWVLTKD